MNLFQAKEVVRAGDGLVAQNSMTTKRELRTIWQRAIAIKQALTLALHCMRTAKLDRYPTHDQLHEEFIDHMERIASCKFQYGRHMR